MSYYEYLQIFAKNINNIWFWGIFFVYLCREVTLLKIQRIYIMLVQFSFGNYKCFKDENCLSMLAPRSNAYSKYSIKTPFRYSLVKTVPIYGANASGKSKFLEAFKFMKCVICPPKRKNKIPVFDYWQTKYDPFRLDTESYKKDSFFECIFVINDLQYRYGFEINSNRITSEWLYQKKQREVLVLSRKGENDLYVNQNINQKISDSVTSAGMLSETVPFISILGTFNEPLCKSIVDWFSSVFVISANDIKVPGGLLTDPKRTEAIVRFLKAFDFNIEGLSLHELPYEDIPEKIKLILDVKDPSGTFYDGIQTQHIVYNHLYERDSTTNFRLEVDESFGTNRLFHLSWPIISAIREGKTLMIDEIDSGIHPNIVKMIIELFNQCGSNAQLIFTIHNTSMFNIKGYDDSALFKKDQVYIVNKNRYGESSLKPITYLGSDLRSNIEKVYLSGEVKGVPYIDVETILDIIKDK